MKDIASRLNCQLTTIKSPKGPKVLKKPKRIQLTKKHRKQNGEETINTKGVIR